MEQCTNHCKQLLSCWAQVITDWRQRSPPGTCPAADLPARVGPGAGAVPCACSHEQGPLRIQHQPARTFLLDHVLTVQLKEGDLERRAQLPCQPQPVSSMATVLFYIHKWSSRRIRSIIMSKEQADFAGGLRLLKAIWTAQASPDCS